MKRAFACGFTVGILLAASGAGAATFADTAKVTAVTHRTERVSRPVEECRTEYERVERTQGAQSSSNIAGSIAGGVAGAILGNQIGGGSGKTVATAAGAIAGTMIGDHLSSAAPGSHTVSEEVPVRRCTTTEKVEHISRGYDVTYEWGGRTFNTTTTHHPGSQIGVNVSVTPSRQPVRP